MERLHPRNRRQGKKLVQVARIQARGQLYIPGSTHAPEAEFDEALAAFGFAQDDGEAGEADGVCYLWPCNVATFNLWQNLQTQWRAKPMGGRSGLDYGAVAAYMRDVLLIKPKERAELFTGIQAMELAALEEWAQQGSN